MASRQPPHGSDSISRSTMPRADRQALARGMLRSSLASQSMSRQLAPNLESISRSTTSSADIHAMAHRMLHSSLNEPSSSTLPQPSSSSLDIYPMSSNQPYPSSTTRRALSSSRTATSLSNQHQTSTAVSSIHPDERRRVAEMEFNNRRRVERRVKREGEAAVSAIEAEARLIGLQNQVSRFHGSMFRPSTDGIFKNTCSTDLLFLIDTTWSMHPYIDAAKNQVISIMNDINAAFFKKAEVRMAVVGYKDHGDSHHIQGLDFTSDPSQVHSFLTTLVASGGGDIPEDVLGGLSQATEASWNLANRCIIHITDAPPHGCTLHDLDDVDDRFHQPGSEPHRLTHEVVLKGLIDKSINYALLRINRSTDRMAYTFFNAYAALSPNCRLHESNTYHPLAAKILSRSFNPGFQGWSVSNRPSQNNLLFEELDLGTSYDSLKSLVVKAVTASASRFASISISGRHPGNPVAALSPTDQRLNDDHELPVSLDTAPPQWNNLDWFNEVVEFESFTTNVVAHDNSMLDQMMDHDDNIKITTTNLTVHKRDQPFAQGGLRIAAYARLHASHNHLVVKSYKRQGKRLAHLIEDMRCQALCKAFALEFNAMLPEKYSLDFIVVTCLKPKSGTNRIGGDCLSLEPLIEGEYVKYNSNAGGVNDDNPSDPVSMAAQAFSHFTFERSLGRFLVSDLQGVGRVLTDPSVQSRDKNRFQLNDTNLHDQGFLFFFAFHKCNKVCQHLGLKSNRTMFLSGKFDFRKIWPDEVEVANMMICCSNKLCSKIVRMAKAKTSDEFPGFRWCDKCWCELHRRTKHVCTYTSPPHEFELSLFFYESQGQIQPRLCPDHRDGRAGTASSSIGAPQSVPDCRYGDGCISMDCPFVHLKPPCTHAATCNKLDCNLRHSNQVCLVNFYVHLESELIAPMQIRGRLHQYELQLPAFSGTLPEAFRL
ncbi:hypothetical protein Neosp_003114 [[Neocosmospora] mangrovei]